MAYRDQVPAAASPSSSWPRAVLLVAARPRLWTTALVQLRRTVPARWWRRPPFAPVPSREYVRFRLHTQYGAAGAPEPHDVVTYLEWCRDMARSQRRRAGARR
jgi:hypothetical protein